MTMVQCANLFKMTLYSKGPLPRSQSHFFVHKIGVKTIICYKFLKIHIKMNMYTKFQIDVSINSWETNFIQKLYMKQYRLKEEQTKGKTTTQIRK